MIRLPMAVSLMLMLLSSAAQAADAQRISFLEQEVRNLQRQVQALTRQVDEMRARAARPASRSVTPIQPPSHELPSWVDASKWARARPGMSELDVIGLLGVPSSMREERGARVLYYALEIGTSGFLGGSVRLQDGVVAEVRSPALQ
jgi:hypothetical protein